MTTNNTLPETVAKLEARRAAIPAELEDLRARRGAAALNAATSGKPAALDTVDRDIATLEREQGDIAAALEEAQHQLREQKKRAVIDRARAAAKQLPATEKALRAACAKVVAAFEQLNQAAHHLRQVEQEANTVASNATPLQAGRGDAYMTLAMRFRLSPMVGPLLAQALSPDCDAYPRTIAEQFDEHITKVAERIGPDCERRVAELEREMQDERAGIQRNPHSELVAHQSEVLARHQRGRLAVA